MTPILLLLLHVGTADDIDRLLAEYDFIVVACPLTPETEGLMDARALSIMKRDAVLVRIKRPSLLQRIVELAHFSVVHV